MFLPSGTHQYNPKFTKIPLKLNEFESVINNHFYIHMYKYIMHSLETQKMKKIYIKTLDARELIMLLFWLGNLLA